MPSWYFKKLRPGDTTREPIQGEFFSTEAISDNAEALVREGIQNSLDARRGNERVIVRIRISGVEHATAPAADAEFVEGAWLHLQARGTGLQDAPLPKDRCNFLLFEDFGTTGLDGDPAQWHRRFSLPKPQGDTKTRKKNPRKKQRPERTEEEFATPMPCGFQIAAGHPARATQHLGGLEPRRRLHWRLDPSAYERRMATVPLVSIPHREAGIGQAVWIKCRRRTPPRTKTTHSAAPFMPRAISGSRRVIT